MAAITVFGKPSCMQCTMTTKAFDRAGLVAGEDYIYRDVLADERAYAYVTEDLGYSAAPVVVLDDHDHWSGYQPDHNKRAIAWALRQREAAPHGAPAASQRQAQELVQGAEARAPAITAPQPSNVIDARERLAAQREQARSLAGRADAIQHSPTEQPTTETRTAPGEVRPETLGPSPLITVLARARAVAATGPEPQAAHAAPPPIALAEQRAIQA